MASSEDKNFIAACFRGRSKAQMSVGNHLGTISTAALPLNSQPIRRHDEGLEGESLVVLRKLGRRGLLNIDLNVPPPEAPDCELTAEDGGGNGPDTLPPPPPPADVAPDDSAKKAGTSDEGELNFDCEMRTAEMEEIKGSNRRWIALIGVAENALREKKEEEIRKRKRGVTQEAELGGEAAAAATRKKNFSGQRRQSLVEGWNREVAEAVVVRSTRGRAVAMPSKYKDSLLGAAAAAAVELPRHNKNGKSGTVFCTKRRSSCFYHRPLQCCTIPTSIKIRPWFLSLRIAPPTIRPPPPRGSTSQMCLHRILTTIATVPPAPLIAAIPSLLATEAEKTNDGNGTVCVRTCSRFDFNSPEAKESLSSSGGGGDTSDVDHDDRGGDRAERRLCMLIEAAELIFGEFVDGDKSELKNDVAVAIGGELEETPVVRSKRGRTRVIPCRYRDSVVEPLTRFRKTCSSGLPVPVKRRRR